MNQKRRLASGQAAKSLVDDLPLLHRELRRLEQEAETLRETIRQVYDIAQSHGIPVEEDPNNAVEEYRPLRRAEAVLAVMREIPRVWRAREVHQALLRRGWVARDVMHPAEGTDAVIQRLLKAGKIERVGRGRYRIQR